MTSKFTEHLCPEQNKKLHIFYIDFDINDDGKMVPSEEKFADELFLDIPYFAFGEDQVKQRVNNDPVKMVELLRESLRKIYQIPEINKANSYYLDSENIEEKYLRRGEFGELILYHLLHEYFGAKSLISKIYFKDTANLPAHGFDAVHVDVENKSLWLGESKLYTQGNGAIDALLSDLREHFNTDFFNSEFTIITNRVQDDDSDTPEFVKELISPDTKTLDKLANIKVALFAGYTSEFVAQYDSQDKFEEEICEETIKLQQRLDKGKQKHGWNSRLDVYLFLFPLSNKMEFVKSLHLKLRGAQQI
ncbi:DUF1837 domain-containing protein [Liquorilactobacillus satsumensis]|nr:DUF1837 domain-containing protein [Liquorilactobacillus satsumensis]MCP9312201.1 DUF1837 domain-containing protein [Liquorilactobacillus satsumensis]MCP9359480.1 DUF1837 domain-containing protein [Liquorilactobacillus satsumensis]